MSIIDTLTLGGVLDQLANRVESLISDAEKAAQFTLVQAGGELNYVIANAQAAYKDMLDTTFAKLDQSVRSAVAQIDTMATQLENKAITSLDKFTHDAQQIVNTLPFRNTDPQVTSYGPKSLVPKNTTEPVTITIEGNFVSVQKPGFKPYLKIGGQQFDAAEASTQQLAFTVPMNVLTSPNVTGISHVNLSLGVPYESAPGCALGSIPVLAGLFTTKAEGTFNLMIGLLPISPGKFRVSHKVSSNTVVTQHGLVSPTWEQDSNDDDIPSDPQKNTRPYSYQDPNTRDPAWHVVPGTHRFVTEWSQGTCQNDGHSGDWDWRYEFISDIPASWGVATIHRYLGTSGKVKFHFQYAMQRAVTQDSWQDESVQLGWGELHAFDDPTGRWKIEYDDFKGVHHEYMAGDQDGPFIAVIDNGSNVTLQVRAPDAIRW